MFISFRKMHGLGNDFVIVDARESTGQAGFRPDAAQLVAMADRHTGIGCDQFAFLRESDRADIFADMYNADGSSLRACGNATRCIAALLMDETGRDEVTVETVAGVLACTKAGGGLVTVDMGEPSFDWQAIPLAREADTLRLPLALGEGAAVNMGNPHVVFFVEDVEAVDLAALGPQVEHDALFPDRVNVEVIEVKAPDHLRMRVWERGTGITMACGTGACASLVAAARKGLSGRRARIELDGGMLEIEWRGDNHVLMTGPWAESFMGMWPHG